jgi:hypothetical protein
MKDELLNKTIGFASDDQAKNLRLTCRSLTPTAEAKAIAWEDCSNPDKGFSSYERSALWSGFWNTKAHDHTKAYFKNYISKINELKDHGDKDYVGCFVGAMCPN